MLFFLTLTQQCNLKCTYCGSFENGDIEDMYRPHPLDLRYGMKNLTKLNKIKDELIIAFYGGEPTLKPRLIRQVIEILPNAKFVLQTNGTLLNHFPQDLLLKMDTILISIDGGEEVTDFSRGKGTWRKAINNSQMLRDIGFKGDLIARMTCSHISNIGKDVRDLIELNIFDHVHWQLDALWSTPAYTGYENFHGWRDAVYNPGITQLANWFIEELKHGRVLGIVPFLGLLHSMLKGEKATLRCGAGLDAFNVTTAGNISACPIAPETYSLAHIEDENFEAEQLRDSVHVGGKCATCDVRDECGGRCLYANKTMWWGDAGFDDVCVTIRHLIHHVRAMLPIVRQLLEDGVIQRDDLHYPKYNNTTEIIP